MKTTTTPAALGYRLPAEWEPHQATLLAWPHEKEDWPGKFSAIPWVYAEIVRLLARSEKVRILVNDTKAQTAAQKLLRQADVSTAGLDWQILPTDRVWTRDSGPICVAKPGSNRARDIAATHWRFNGWAKYENWQRDAEVPAAVAKALDLPVFRVEFAQHHIVLEGGSIDTNGEGCLLTTEECLLSEVQARNPQLSKRDYQQLFSNYFGCSQVLWLGRGIAGDDTHGHVDDVARFVAPDKIVAAVEKNYGDDNYEPLQENLDRLRGFRTLSGKKFEVIELPMPRPIRFSSGRSLPIRLPASYANFYIANNCVLVPTFNDPADRVALGILAELFPKRIVCGIHALDLVWGLGTLHCLTQQIPSTT